MGDSPAAASAAVMGTKGSLALLREERQLVRRGGTAGCRWASRSVLLTILAVRSSGAGRQVLCSNWDRCRRLMEGRPVVPRIVVGAARRVGP